MANSVLIMQRLKEELNSDEDFEYTHKLPAHILAPISKPVDVSEEHYQFILDDLREYDAEHQTHFVLDDEVCDLLDDNIQHSVDICLGINTLINGNNLTRENLIDVIQAGPNASQRAEQHNQLLEEANVVHAASADVESAKRFTM